MSIFARDHYEDDDPSLAAADWRAKKAAGTLGNTVHTFRVNDHIKVITLGQDFFFFYGETGVIERIEDRHLGIQVRFDEPRHFQGGMVQERFGFDPEDLLVIEAVTQ